jgi:hypothetical protein
VELHFRPRRGAHFPLLPAQMESAGYHPGSLFPRCRDQLRGRIQHCSTTAEFQSHPAGDLQRSGHGYHKWHHPQPTADRPRIAAVKRAFPQLDARPSPSHRTVSVVLRRIPGTTRLLDRRRCSKGLGPQRTTAMTAGAIN